MWCCGVDCARNNQAGRPMAAHAHCVQGPILHICALKSPACQFCCRCFVCRHPGSSGLKPGLAENPASEALLSSQPFCAALVFVGKQCPLFSGTLSPLGFSLFFFFFFLLCSFQSGACPGPGGLISWCLVLAITCLLGLGLLPSLCKSLSHVQLWATPLIVQSMEFSRPGSWSG